MPCIGKLFLLSYPPPLCYVLAFISFFCKSHFGYIHGIRIMPAYIACNSSIALPYPPSNNDSLNRHAVTVVLRIFWRCDEDKNGLREFNNPLRLALEQRKQTFFFFGSTTNTWCILVDVKKTQSLCLFIFCFYGQHACVLVPPLGKKERKKEERKKCLRIHGRLKMGQGDRC